MDCTRTFMTKSNLGRHGNTTDGNKKGIKPVSTDHKCGFCGKSFSRKSYLRIHVKIIHEEMQIRKCELCEKSFTSKRTLTDHLKNFHYSKKEFKCDFCGKACSLKGNLIQHMKITHKDMEVMKCLCCDKLFFLKSDLEQHLKLSNNTDSFDKHIDQIQKITISCAIETTKAVNKKIHRCNLCGRIFQRHQALKYHRHSRK